MLFNITFHENSFIPSLLGTCGRTEWKKFYCSIFVVSLRSAARKKNYPGAKVMQTYGDRGATILVAK